jgi:hypothetical protein
MTYTPNFNNHQVRNRVYHALGFSEGYFDNDERETATVFLEEYFGRRSKPIHHYLKSIILTCTDARYFPAEHKSKKYKVNTDGFKYIRYRMDNPNDTISYRSWLTKIDASIVAVKEEYNESEYFDDGITTKLTIEDALFNLKSYHEPLFDGKYVKKLIERRYHQQLLTGDFVYKSASYREWNHLQSVFKRDTRQSILASYGYVHAYDIESCAPTLLLQYARMLGFNKSVPAYETYLENKSLFREMFADNANVDVSIVKEVINAIFNGAKLGMNENFALYHVLGGDNIRIKSFTENPVFQLMKKDIKAVWSYIKSCNGVQVDNFEIDFFNMNMMGAEGRFDSKKKWNLYFQLENIVMSSIRSYMREYTIQFFNEHDGWTSRNQLDIMDLKHHVYNTTGFVLNISYQFIIDNGSDIEVVSTDNTESKGESNFVLLDNQVHDESSLHSLSSEPSCPYSSSFVSSSCDDDTISNIIYELPSSLNTLVVPLSDNSVTIPIDKLEHKRMMDRERQRRRRLKLKQLSI